MLSLHKLYFMIELVAMFFYPFIVISAAICCNFRLIYLNWMYLELLLVFHQITFTNLKCDDESILNNNNKNE